MLGSAGKEAQCSALQEALARGAGARSPSLPSPSRKRWSVRVTQPMNDKRWRWGLLAACALVFGVVLSSIFDNFGFGGMPWFGYWDDVLALTGQPFVGQATQVVAGGAAARAGIRDGDRIDLREHGLYDRTSIVFQPVTSKTATVIVHRNGKTFIARVHPSTIYQGDVAIKLPNTSLAMLAYLLALACAFVIALRRWQTHEGRCLCLTLLAISAETIGPVLLAVPDGTLGSLKYAILGVVVCAQALLPVALAATFGVRSPWRAAVEAIAIIAAALTLAGYVAATIGVLNLSIDPMPFVNGVFWQALGVAIFVIATIAVAIATAKTPQADRARTAWLLLPLPIALAAATLATVLEEFATSWVTYMSLSAVSNGLLLLGAGAVTFALLKRRVLDLEFVVSRTLVVATVSLIVVAAFVLLEWLLGSAVAHVSRTTGLIANAGLALALGLSVNYIHKRVDAFIEALFFRKRREDERALLDFSREAAYVTDSDELVDRAIETVEHHTDARSGAILLDGAGAYTVARSFGNGLSALVGENDGAILALKTWHRPLDPHHYSTSMEGALALPMLARGRLLGVLLLGERAGGEAYAPDEVEALSQLAHGVGSAMDALSIHAGDSIAALRESLASIAAEIVSLGTAIRALPDSIASELRRERPH
jgi:hypothetical protein